VQRPSWKQSCQSADCGSNTRPARSHVRRCRLRSTSVAASSPSGVTPAASTRQELRHNQLPRVCRGNGRRSPAELRAERSSRPGAAYRYVVTSMELDNEGPNPSSATGRSSEIECKVLILERSMEPPLLMRSRPGLPSLSTRSEKHLASTATHRGDRVRRAQGQKKYFATRIRQTYKGTT